MPRVKTSNFENLHVIPQFHDMLIQCEYLDALNHIHHTLLDEFYDFNMSF